MTRSQYRDLENYDDYAAALGAMWASALRDGIDFISWAHIEQILLPSFGLPPHWGITTTILSGWGFTITDKGVSYEIR